MDTIKQLSFFTIDLMKSAINHDENLSGKARELIFQIGKEFDRCKVNNEPMNEIEYLYNTALWLSEQIFTDDEQKESI